MSKRARTKTDPAAVVMVRMIVTEDGTLYVTVDGAPYLPPEFSPPWRRGSAYPHIVDAISQHTGRTLRVDVVEIDGRVITDYRTPHLPRPVGPSTLSRRSGRAAASCRLRGSRRTSGGGATAFTQLAGRGFVPGEDVAVAIIIAHTETAPNGIARAIIDSRYLDGMPDGRSYPRGPHLRHPLCSGGRE